MCTFSSMMLVEGKSEETVIPKLCSLCGVEPRFAIKSENSLSELKTALRSYLKSTNTLRKLWVIIDADVNFDGAWQSIKDILSRSGKYEIDSRMPLPENGIVIAPKDDADLTIGVWIMPNNTDIGMLEDFMLELIPEDDTLIGTADEVVTRLDGERALHSGLFKAVHKSKARIHTWLAWHNTPGESLSVAVQKRLFATDKELCRRFAAWVGQLVE